MNKRIAGAIILGALAITLAAGSSYVWVKYRPCELPVCTPT